MDYTQLTGSKSTPGSVAAWLNNSTIVNDVPEIVLEAESWIYRRLRHWRMLTPVNYGFLVTGLDYLTNPADMLEPFLLFLSGQFFQTIQQRTPQEVVSNFAWQPSGAIYVRVQQQPMMYYFDESALRFDSPPDQDYGYGLIYFQQPAPLADTNTNFLTSFYPRLLRATIMAGATEWAKDSGVGTYDRTYWVQIQQDEIEKAQQESDRAKRATEAGAILIGGGISSNYPAFNYGY